jgi:LysM repeat protein
VRRGRPLRPALAGWRLGVAALTVLAAPFLIVFLLLAEFGVLIDDDEEARQTVAEPALDDEPTLILDDADAVAQDLTLETEQPTSPSDEAAAPEPESEDEQIYTVVPGDTLALIAFRHATTVRALAAYNEIVNVDRLDVGQQLRIPPPGYEPPPDSVTNDATDDPDDTATGDSPTQETPDATTPQPTPAN